MVAHSVEPFLGGAFPGGELSKKQGENRAENFDGWSLSAGNRAEADRHKSYWRDYGRTAPDVAQAMDR